ncbi:MAG: helix-turn-helix domain-containing protein [Phenylobacterium sp.]|jgi:excisionase family DNA binding protein|nr:helix-turn-helix domain-containing protein [Phenylobacterium sp.]MDZ4322207.1 helix-turn-helix domain-containing protein [Phenylobacterium sp.]
MQPIFLSINDTAKALGLGRTSIYGLLRSGRLEAVKLGRRTLVKVESIRRLIEAA